MTAITEAEAKEKTCHLTLAKAIWGTCFASQCMAWQWSEQGYETAVTDDEHSGISWRFVPPDNDPAWQRVASGSMAENRQFRQYADDLPSGKTMWRRPKKLERGYCGLASSGEPLLRY